MCGHNLIPVPVPTHLQVIVLTHGRASVQFTTFTIYYIIYTPDIFYNHLAALSRNLRRHLANLHGPRIDWAYRQTKLTPMLRQHNGSWVLVYIIGTGRLNNFPQSTLDWYQSGIAFAQTHRLELAIDSALGNLVKYKFYQEIEQKHMRENWS